MENFSQKVCSQCSHYEECTSIAINKPELVVKCIHFGYIKQIADDAIKMVQIQMDECIREYMNRFIGQKEN